MGRNQLSGQCLFSLFESQHFGGEFLKVRRFKRNTLQLFPVRFNLMLQILVGKIQLPVLFFQLPDERQLRFLFTGFLSRELHLQFLDTFIVLCH